MVGVPVPWPVPILTRGGTYWEVEVDIEEERGAGLACNYMHNTQKGQKCCANHSPFTSTFHNGDNVPCSRIITQIARRRACCRHHRHRRIGTPMGRCI